MFISLLKPQDGEADARLFKTESEARRDFEKRVFDIFDGKVPDLIIPGPGKKIEAGGVFPVSNQVAR